MGDRKDEFEAERENNFQKIMLQLLEEKKKSTIIMEMKNQI